MDSADHMIRGLLAEAERKRAAAREREARARHEADMFTVEVEAYKKALSALGQPSPPQEQEKPIKKVISTGAKPTIVGGGKWLQVYARLVATSMPPYSYENIARAASDVGHEVSDGGFRAQMMNAVKAGLFTRPGPGQFVATEEGIKLFGTSIPENTVNASAAKGNAEEARDLLGVLNPNPALTGA
jgi:hypothetical protein